MTPDLVPLTAAPLAPGRLVLVDPTRPAAAGPAAGAPLGELAAAAPTPWVGGAALAEAGPEPPWRVYWAAPPAAAGPRAARRPDGEPAAELWWVVAAAPGSRLRFGGPGEEVEVPARPDAVWRLAPGTPAAVGPGAVVLRLTEGELHPAEAGETRAPREVTPRAAPGGGEVLLLGAALTAERIPRLTAPLGGRTDGRRYHLLVVVRGAVAVGREGGGGDHTLTAPQALFVPAAPSAYRLTPVGGAAAVLVAAPLPGPVLPMRTGLRLQRVLAAAGHGSRRRAEELIRAGRVTVDGVVVTTLGTRVDPERQAVAVDGERVRWPRQRVYYALYKPRGVVCSHREEGDRPRAVDYLPAAPPVFPVGRLDVDSEGLLLLTNDGEWADRVAHPRYGVPKVYLVKVRGRVAPKHLEALRRGVWLHEGRTGGFAVEVRRVQENSTWLRVTLTEGRNREIRRALAALGYPVKRLKRVRIGPVSLHGLAPGRHRVLTPAEVESLRRGPPPPPPAADDVFLPPRRRRSR